MKRIDIYNFQRGLELTEFTHIRATFTVNDNKRKSADYIKKMEKEIEPSDDFKEFEKEREELAKKHSFKDDKGEPKLIRKAGRILSQIVSMYDVEGIENDKSRYNIALSKLNKKHKEAIEKQEEKVRMYNEEFLNDECDFTPTKIKMRLIEEHEKCPQGVMDLIFPMIKLD